MRARCYYIMVRLHARCYCIMVHLQQSAIRCEANSKIEHMYLTILLRSSARSPLSRVLPVVLACLLLHAVCQQGELPAMLASSAGHQGIAETLEVGLQFERGRAEQI